LGARTAALLAVALLAAACGSLPEAPYGGPHARPPGGPPGEEEEPWTRIVRGSTGERVLRGTLTEALRDADYVLLGEIHDNAIHHRLQWVVLDELAPRPLVMEQFDVEVQPALDAAIAARGGAASVLEAGKMARTWNWAFYKPLVEITLDRNQPVVAGNLSRTDARAVASKGFEALPDAAALAIDKVWDDERERSLVQQLVESHCGKLPPEAAPGIVRAQRARDAVMADRMLRYPRAVLIAGSGHTRIDRGVPVYLKERAPGRKVVSIGFVEGKDDADSARNFDFVWITDTQPREDPCASMKMPDATAAPAGTP
jgi:uncharacterized iron-regulated protein